MTNRPSGGAAVRWRIPVPLKNVTNTLWVLCSWFKPVIVDANTTPASTLHNKWNPSEVIDDNYKEFCAQHIICCPSMEWSEESGCCVMQKEINDYINDHLEQLRATILCNKRQKSQGKKKAATKPVEAAPTQIPDDLKLTTDVITLGMEAKSRSCETGKEWYAVRIVGILEGGYYTVRYTTAQGKDFNIHIDNMRKPVKGGRDRKPNKRDRDLGG